GQARRVRPQPRDHRHTLHAQRRAVALTAIPNPVSAPRAVSFRSRNRVDNQAYFFGSLKSHVRTVASALTDARRIPLARNVTPCTQAVCPSSDLSICAFAGFHSLTVRSLQHETSTVPLGWNWRPVTELAWPGSERAYFPSGMPKRWICESLPPRARSLPSGLNARD